MAITRRIRSGTPPGAASPAPSVGFTSYGGFSPGHMPGGGIQIRGCECCLTAADYSGLFLVSPADVNTGPMPPPGDPHAADRRGPIPPRGTHRVTTRRPDDGTTPSLVRHHAAPYQSGGSGRRTPKPAFD